MADASKWRFRLSGNQVLGFHRSRATVREPKDALGASNSSTKHPDMKEAPGRVGDQHDIADPVCHRDGSPSNVKEHATLSAGATLDHGVEVDITG
jgi:hypothetical protein